MSQISPLLAAQLDAIKDAHSPSVLAPTLQDLLASAHEQADRCEAALSMLVDALGSVLRSGTPVPEKGLMPVAPVSPVLPAALDRVDALRARLSALTALADMTRERLAL